MSSGIFDTFTHRYRTQKTLRFRLIPQGRTLEHIKAYGILDKDELRAERYLEIKKTVDAYHREYIDGRLSTVRGRIAKGEYVDKEQITSEDFNRFAEIYVAFKRDRKAQDGRKKLKDACDSLRKKLVAECFPEAKKMTFKSLSKDLPEWVARWNSDHKEQLFYDDTFNKFAMYFEGYDKNRENMYSNEDETTAVAHRLINENLPKFCDNAEVYVSRRDDLIALLAEATDEERQFLDPNKLDTMFTYAQYADRLTQTGIDEYNAVLGGFTNSGKGKVRGLNEFVNLHNQKAKDRSARLIAFKPLYKQILADREGISFLPAQFETADEMYQSIVSFYTENLMNDILVDTKEDPGFGSLIGGIGANQFDLEKVYLSQAGLSTISTSVFKWYHFIGEALDYEYRHFNEPDFDEKYASATTGAKVRMDSDLEKFRNAPYVSIACAARSIGHYATVCENASKNSEADFIRYFSDAFHVEHNGKLFCFQKYIEAGYSQVKGELNVSHDRDYRPSEETLRQLKSFMDSIMELLHFVRMFSIRQKDAQDYEKCEDFYVHFDRKYEVLAKFTMLYDKVRNFSTRKPYRTGKTLLTFNKPTLADGWDEKKENEHGSVILRKGRDYFLGIVNKASQGRKSDAFDFSILPEATLGEDAYEKMVYKLFPGVYRNIPRCGLPKPVKSAFAKPGVDSYELSGENFAHPFIITRKLFEVYSTEQYKKDRAALTDWISFCMDFLKTHTSTRIYDFSGLKSADKYETLKEFYADVDNCTYRLSFKNVSAAAIDKAVEDGKLFLFRIHNKDFGNSVGKPNLHTLYWQMLFDETNLRDVVIKLNGRARLFYRVGSITEPVVHKQGSILVSKVTRAGRTIPSDAYVDICKVFSGQKRLEECDEVTKSYYRDCLHRPAPHDIVKDRRYTQDAFLFHVSLDFNFKEPKSIGDFNGKVREFLQAHPETNVIGIDRGERHLLYVSVVSPKGEILEQRTLNIIDTGRSKVDYHEKLDQREKEREKARKSWSVIGIIAEMKEGYLSHAVHVITELMMKYGAVIVLEDLNTGFKRGRFKVEKQVYQKFEKTLISKLTYLAFKDVEPSAPGGVMNAYQLAAPFESFKKMTSQTGFIFYVPAWNTSKIDPVTGFVDTLKPTYTNRTDAKAFFDRFKTIRYDADGDSFEFAWDRWLIGTGNRMRYAWNALANSGRGAMEPYDATASLKAAFEKAGVDWRSANLKACLTTSDDVPLLRAVMKCLRIVLSMRYSSAANGRDYIFSPVKAPNGRYFCTEDATDALPVDADANGAYNIARKGLLLLRSIAETGRHKFIKNDEWLEYAQDDGVCKEQTAKM